MSPSAAWVLRQTFPKLDRVNVTRRFQVFTAAGVQTTVSALDTADALKLVDAPVTAIVDMGAGSV